jgi:PAS domain S-box-containing protein
MASDPEIKESRLDPADRIDLEQVQRILPQLIDALSDAVLVVDRSQRVLAANRRYVEVFGRGLDQAGMAGCACGDAVGCPERASVGDPEPCATCAAIDQRRPTRRLRVVPDATGAPRRWEGTFNPVSDPTGDVTHVVEVWRDVSERSHLESQLGHSERLASLGILAAGVAHEINNPLASIVAGVESLQRWLAQRKKGAAADPRAEEAHEVLALLEQEARRVSEITDKLMLLAQPYSATPVWVDLNRAASDVLHLLRYQMQKQGIRSIEDLDPALPAVWARETGLRGVIMNLSLNAVQAMPEGGTFTVRSRRQGPGRVRLEFTDTGHGIAPEHFDRIWDPFFTTKPPGKGTGLGLSITQRIVSRHGGQIHAENLSGGGAQFVVELPVEGSGGT